MKKVFFSLCLCAFLFSCGDDDADPVLTISSEKTVNVLATEAFTVEGTATDDIGIASVTLNSDAIGISGTISGSDLDASGGQFSVTINLDVETPEGTYDLIVTAIDTGDNTDVETITVNVTQ